MGETINITNYSQDFIRKKVTITASELPEDFDLRIQSKIVPNFNLEVRLGFELGFLEKGNVNVSKNDSTTILNDNEIEGLSDINTGTILMKNQDFVDVRLWNTDGGTFTIIVLLFINSTSNGTFVDALALLEATTKEQTIVTEGDNLTPGEHIFPFSLSGFKNLNIFMEGSTPYEASIINSTWTGSDNVLENTNSTADTGNFSSGDRQFTVDYGSLQDANKSFFIEISQLSAGTAQLQVEYSDDDISYTNLYTNSSLITSFNETVDLGSIPTQFRYIKVILSPVSGTVRGVCTLFAEQNKAGALVDLKIQKNVEGSWKDFISAAEFDTKKDLVNEDDVDVNIGLSFPAASLTSYTFLQGSNKHRIVITVTAFTGFDSSLVGYSGPVTINKFNS